MLAPRVLLADDHAVVRSGLRERLEAEGLLVVGEAADGEQAIALAESLLPDVLVLDMELPKRSGVEVARHLHATHAPVRVLVLSAYDDAAYVAELLASGAAGYLTKDESLDTIVAAVRGVAAGEAGWLSRRAAVRMMHRPAGASKPEPPISTREREVLSHVARGRSNAAIGEALFLSEHTIRNHLAAIYDKLGVHNRAEAVARGLREGWIRSDG